MIRHTPSKIYFKRDGTPIFGPDPQSQWYEERNKCNTTIKKTEINDQLEILTTYNGRAYRFDKQNRPFIFTSTVNKWHEEDDCDEEIDRIEYISEEEAIKGHKKLIKQYS